MTLEMLKTKLQNNNIPANIYSIDEGLKPMAYILYKNYSVWEFFYLNERGGRDGFRIFTNEEQAFEYFWCQIEYYINHPPSTTPPSIFGKRKL